MTIETRPAEVVSAPKVKTTADVLRHAAGIIEEHGWSGSELIDDDGRHCAWAAIAAAIHGPAQGGVLSEFQTDDERPALAALIRVVEGAKADVIFAGGAVANWNDAPGRTAAEVTAALRAAADASERAS